jgi:hypothetical protein
MHANATSPAAAHATSTAPTTVRFDPAAPGEQGSDGPLAGPRDMIKRKLPPLA